jgi:hypothetical protein
MSTTSSPAAPSLEPHYTLAHIAEAWGVSTDTVRRMFEGEPGVLVIEPAPGRYSRRRYRTFRIPASVAERVHRRMTVVNDRGRG